MKASHCSYVLTHQKSLTVPSAHEHPMDELADQLDRKGVALELDESAREHLAKEGYDPAMGARPMARVIHTWIKEPLSEEILFGKLKEGGRVKVDVAKDKESLVFEFPPQRLEGKDRPALTGPVED